MNILFCGDRYMEDGMIISILSLLKNTEDVLHIYILTMGITTQTKQYFPLPAATAVRLDEYVKKKNPDNSVTVTDLTERYQTEIPTPNLETRFSPLCMLRLFADEMEEIPSRILYLDADVVCRQDIREFYEQDMEGWELAGVLDYYGRVFFRRHPFHMDYLNSGVLLLNMEEIRRTGLFRKCREQCRTKKMFMPDQSSLNRLAQKKKICAGKYNEQRRLRRDTVMQHFTTTFRFFPWLHTLTVKPWQIDQLHRKLKIHEYDDILAEYKKLKHALEGLNL